MGLIRKTMTKVQREGMASVLSSLRDKLERMGHRSVQSLLMGRVVTTRGITLDLQNARVSRRMKTELARGTYELEEIEAIESYLSSESDVIELGGCIGYTACYTNKILKKGARHVVVEPNSALEPVLQHNRRLNGCDYEIYCAAYSSDQGPITIDIPENIWGASLVRDERDSVTVDAVDLEWLMEKFDISQFTLIADIEGAEVDLIDNELDVLEAHCELLIIEFHHRKDEYSHIAAEIESARAKLDDSSFTCLVRKNSGVSVYRNEML